MISFLSGFDPAFICDFSNQRQGTHPVFVFCFFSSWHIECINYLKSVVLMYTFLFWPITNMLLSFTLIFNMSETSSVWWRSPFFEKFQSVNILLFAVQFYLKFSEFLYFKSPSFRSQQTCSCSYLKKKTEKTLLKPLNLHICFQHPWRYFVLSYYNNMTTYIPLP